MISYLPGRLYLVRNIATGAGSYFRPLEVFPCNGHRVMYGEVLRYEFRIGAGPRLVGAKPVAFGQPRWERYGQKGWKALAYLIATTNGEEGRNGLFGRLRVSEMPLDRDPQTAPVKHAECPEGQEEPLYAFGQVEARIFGGTNYVGTWSDKVPNRDGLVYTAKRSLDLFDDTVNLGHIPAWFINAQRLAHCGIYLAEAAAA